MMRISELTPSGAVAAAFILTACGAGGGGGEDLAEELFAACEDQGGSLIVQDGSSVKLVVEGDDARSFAEFGDADAESLANGDLPEGGLGVTFAYINGSECLARATGFPGAADQLRDGDEWDGWEFTEESGVGAEFTISFVSDGSGSVTPPPPEVIPSPSDASSTTAAPPTSLGSNLQSLHEAIGCTEPFAVGGIPPQYPDAVYYPCIPRFKTDIFVFPDAAGRDEFVANSQETMDSGIVPWSLVAGTGSETWVVLGAEDRILNAAVAQGGVLHD